MCLVKVMYGYASNNESLLRRCLALLLGLRLLVWTNCHSRLVDPSPSKRHAMGCVQAQIAMVNTTLTAAGMWALAIPGMGLLSLFVFICSFIPIAGCFISTVPVAFVALTEYGFLKVGLSSSHP